MMHPFVRRFTLLAAAVLLLAVLRPEPAAAQSEYNEQLLDYKPRILLVTAHPDDDALFSATVFKTTHLLGGTVDLALMTNGEGGYRYSTLGNFIYGRQLDKEVVGRAWLPSIRKRELMAGGRIVGMRNYYFFDQVDRQYTEDPAVPLEEWDTGYITRRLKEIIREQKYDFVFTMLPHPGTHGHHKASAILLLRALQDMDPGARPLAVATTMLRSVDEENTDFRLLEGYPETRLDDRVAPFEFDRTQTFGNEDRLDYNIIANWVIAEHKSQGTMQQLMNGGAVEQYWYYELNRKGGAQKLRAYFEAVEAADIYFRDDETPSGDGN